MPRYIDAERLERVLEKNFGNLGGAGVLVQLIQAQPAADVEEIKLGQWVDGQCSACGIPAITFKGLNGTVMRIETPCCCACGARMDGEGSQTNERQP